ncbi:hypothetical protein ACFE04_005402 [Oxalis oulophora]
MDPSKEGNSIVKSTPEFSEEDPIRGKRVHYSEENQISNFASVEETLRTKSGFKDGDNTKILTLEQNHSETLSCQGAQIPGKQMLVYKKKGTVSNPSNIVERPIGASPMKESSYNPRALGQKRKQSPGREETISSRTRARNLKQAARDRGHEELQHHGQAISPSPPNLSPLGSVLLLGNPFLLNAVSGGGGGFGDVSEVGFESSRVFFLLPFLLFQKGGDGSMDLSKVGEKILSSVRSARSLGLLPSTSDHRPEVPAEAAAAAVVARALAGLPPHQRYSLSSSSTELSSIYASKSHGHELEELEDCFYEEEFDAIGYILENVPDEENELSYFEKQEVLRLAQLDRVAEHLSRNVMEHHEVMGKLFLRIIQLVYARVLCDFADESSHDVLPILGELRRALEMQMALESLVEEGNYCKAFQVLSEFLQLLDSFSELSAMQEMGRGVEVWLGKTLQKLDSLLIGVCQEFKEESYITVVDASALIGDISGLADKIQSFFMQEVFSETHSVLKTTLLEDQEATMQNSRLTYSDLCQQIPESKFRQCLLRTLSTLFKLMSSYYEIMSFQPVNKLNVEACEQPDVSQPQEEVQKIDSLARISCTDQPTSTVSISDQQGIKFSRNTDSNDSVNNGGNPTSSHESPWYQLRKDATAFVSQTLQRGCKNLLQLLTSRVSVLLSSASVYSTSIHQFLKIYEDLNTFILAGEAFCGVEAVEFRQKLKDVCENYFAGFHRQNALKMVIEKEDWQKLSPDTVQVISFPGLVGDGAPLINPADKNSTNSRVLHSSNSPTSDGNNIAKKSGFSFWAKSGNPYLPKIINTSTKEYLDGVSGEYDGDNDNNLHGYKETPRHSDSNHMNGTNSYSDDENEDLLADFIDEDSQLPSRISNRNARRNRSSHWTDDDIMAQTGSSLCLLRSMDRYARLMQKLEIVNVEFFKGMCQLFEIFFHYVFETFGQQNSTGGKSSTESLNYRLKAALSRVTQDCEEWLRPQSSPFSSSSSPTAFNSSFPHVDVTPTSPRSRSFGHTSAASFGLKERCAGADSISLVSRILHRSKGHLQSVLLLKNGAIVEDFFAHLVDPVPDLTQHIHKTTARSLLHINGYVDRVANAKWEVKELGLEHNGYVDLLLGEFKHYKTRLNHGGIQPEVQELLLEYGVDIVAETLVEGLSRVKRCTDEGRALMSLDLQVLISGLQHFVSESVKPKFLIVETFIKAYYLPETEYVHWARAHPEYTKNQIVGLVNLVAAMKGWKRKSRLEVLEKI